jgi:membrane protein YqaA with SNARE-associated domain
VWGILRLQRLRRVRLHRYWRSFVVALGGCAAIGAAVVLVAPAFAGLFLFGLYAIPSNSILPIPHEPGLLYFARFYHPAWIALAATFGSALVCFADYAIVGAALRHPRVKSASEARLFRWAVRWMTRYPFAIVVLFACVPLPVYVVRILAPASGYPIGRYILAQVIGRFPRFYLLAWIGHAVQLPVWLLVAMFVALLAVFFLGGRAPAADDEDPDSEPIGVPDLRDPERPTPAVP